MARDFEADLLIVQAAVGGHQSLKRIVPEFQPPSAMIVGKE